MPRRIPKYEQVAAHLRDQISAGTLVPGAILPGEHDLSAEFNVVRETVRRGLELLRNEGLIESRHPYGWFVRKREYMVFHPLDELGRKGQKVESFINQIRQEGRKPAQEIDIAITHPPQVVAERLHLHNDQLVVCRQRIRSINNEAVNLNDSYYPFDLVKDSPVVDPTDIPNGVSSVLDDLGYDQVRGHHEVFTSMPTPEQRDRLNLGPGTPVLLHIVTSYTASNAPVRCTINTLPGDRNKIEFDGNWNR